MDMQFLLCLIVTWYGKVHRIVTDLGILIWIQKIRAAFTVFLNRLVFSTEFAENKVSLAELMHSKAMLRNRCSTGIVSKNFP